jgi:hypothetical protein
VLGGQAEGQRAAEAVPQDADPVQPEGVEQRDQLSTQRDGV